jgi:hypothetical protein
MPLPGKVVCALPLRQTSAEGALHRITFYLRWDVRRFSGHTVFNRPTVLGFDFADIVSVIEALMSADFYKNMTTYADHWFGKTCIGQPG